MALLRTLLRAIEHPENPDLANAYNKEIHKLEETGYTIKITNLESASSSESWFVPHHIVQHNGNTWLVFTVIALSTTKQLSLNDNLLPGPTLCLPLLRVLLRFREHADAISGDIQAIFFVLSDQAVTCYLGFLWRDMERECLLISINGRVLLFGTTCSPC